MNQKEMVTMMMGMGMSLPEALEAIKQSGKPTGITGYHEATSPRKEPVKATASAFEDLVVDSLQAGSDTTELGTQHKHMKGLLTATVVTALTHEDCDIWEKCQDQVEFNTEVNKLLTKTLKDKLADGDGKVLNRAGNRVDAFNDDDTCKYKETAYASTFEQAIKMGMWVFRVMDIGKTQAEAIDAVTCEKSIGGTSYLTLKSRAKLMELVGTDFEAYLKNQFDVVLVGVLRKITDSATQEKAKDLIKKFASDAPAIIGVPKPAPAKK
jgi:hypothetical protein